MKSYFTKEFQAVFFTTLALIVVNAFGLLFCNYTDANRDAQRYYKQFEPIKFYVMHFCYTILLISITYNVRFLIIGILKNIGTKMMKKYK